MSARARPFGAIVLAAGASSRMGRPKALLDFDGRTAAALALEACLDGGAARVAIVVGSRAARVLAALRAGRALETRVVPVVHRGWSRGRTSSIRRGIRALPAATGGILVLPVDQPLVTRREVAALARAYAADRDGERRIFVAAHRGRRGHPVLFGSALRSRILALRDGQPLHDLVRAEPRRVREVPTPNRFVLVDADGPASYAALLEAYRARRRLGRRRSAGGRRARSSQRSS